MTGVKHTFKVMLSNVALIKKGLRLNGNCKISRFNPFKKGLRLTMALLCYKVSSLSNVALIKKGLRH